MIPLTIHLIAFALQSPVTPPSTVDVRGADEAGRYTVSYGFPSAGVAQLDLVDMTTQSPACPSINYEIEMIEGAARAGGAAGRRIIRLTPTASDWIRITYSVRTDDPEGALIGTDEPCDLLVRRGQNQFLDGKALFLAPRPADAAEEAFRIGATVLTIGPDLPNPLTTSLTGDGADGAGGVWRVDHFDTLRFSLFFAGPLTHSAEQVRIATLGTERAHAGLAIHDAPLAMRAFETLFGVPAPQNYLIVLLETGEGAPGDITGTGRAGGHLIVTGDRAGRLITRLVNIHELAHHWDLSSFRMMDPTADLTWMREGLAEYLSFWALTSSGSVSEAEVIGRANIALYNLAQQRVPTSTPYDHGFLVWLSLDRASRNTAAFGGLLRSLIEPAAHPLTDGELWREAYRQGLWPAPDTQFDAARHLPCTLVAEEREHHLMSGHWPLYDTGYVHASGESNAPLVIAPGGPAARAGLRETDRIIELFSGAYGEILRDVTLRLGDGRVLAYRPHGARAPTAFMQYVEPGNVDNYEAGAKRIARCRR